MKTEAGAILKAKKEGVTFSLNSHSLDSLTAMAMSKMDEHVPNMT